MCNTETLLFSTHYEKHSSETECKGLYQFYWETLIFIAVGFTWVKTERGLDATGAHNEVGFGACMKLQVQIEAMFRRWQSSTSFPPNTGDTSHSWPMVPADLWAAFLPRTTNKLCSQLVPPQQTFWWHDVRVLRATVSAFSKSDFPVSIYWSDSILLLTDSYL